MPRGTPRTIDDRIALIDEKIKKKQDEIKKLKEQRKTIVDARNSELAEQVAQISTEKGISLDELLKMVEGK